MLDIEKIMETDEYDKLDCTGLTGSMPLILLAAKRKILEEKGYLFMITTDPDTCIDIPMWCEYQEKKYSGPFIHNDQGTKVFVHIIRNPEFEMIKEVM